MAHPVLTNIKSNQNLEAFTHSLEADFTIFYLYSYPEFHPSHGDFDISVITVRCQTKFPKPPTVSPEIPENYICRQLTPVGTIHFGVFDFPVLRGFQNTLYLHIRH